MELFIKTCCGVLLSVILILTIGSGGKDLSLALGIAVCCMVAVAAMEYLRPVLRFIEQLEELVSLDHSLIRILLKVTGIGMICEIGALVCTDSGCAAVGKTVKILGTAAILWLSLPLYAMLVDLLEGILVGL